MPVFDIFSKRQKKLRGEMPDVYDYDDLPKPLRVQIVHIWRDTLDANDSERYKFIVDTLCREYGVFALAETDSIMRNYIEEFFTFFLQANNVENALDAVELSFQVIDEYSSNPDEAIEELNERFKEHGVGYQFTNGRIVRVDSEFIHAEIVKPALKLLDQPHYAGAQQEFSEAV